MVEREVEQENELFLKALKYMVENGLLKAQEPSISSNNGRRRG